MNRLAIYLLALGAFLAGTAELVVAGILPVIARDLDISIALAGQSITAYSLAFAIGTPILITLTSRMSRKRVLVGSLAVFVLGSLASFASLEYAVFLISRVVLGLSAGVFSVAAVSSIVKLVPADRTGSAISMIALGFGSAMALGVPIGVAVADRWSWQAVFALLGALSLAVLAGLLRLLPDIEGDAQSGFGRQVSILRNPVILSGLALSFFLCMSNSILLTYITPFLQTILHMTTAGTGAMMLLLGVAGVIGSRFGGFGVDRWGSVRMLVLTLAAAAVSLAMLPIFTAPMVISAVWMIVWMLSIFMNAPALQTYFIQQAPQSSNFVLSLNLSIIHLGIAIGAGVGGVMMDSASTVLYHPWAASGMAALSLGAAFVSVSRRKLANTAGLQPKSSP